MKEILLVLDGTTGLNMLPQAREFNEVKLFLVHLCYEQMPLQRLPINWIKKMNKSDQVIGHNRNTFSYEFEPILRLEGI